MKTRLLKSSLFFSFVFCVLHSLAQEQKIRKVYEYVLNDSAKEKKDMKLFRVTNEPYDQQKLFNTGSGILSPTPNNTFSLKKDQTIKDGKFTYQYSFERKSATIKKLDTYNKNLLSVKNIYFGVNNRLCDEITVDEKTKHKESKHYLYDRQSRLAKIISYNNGKVNGYVIYEYEDANDNIDYTAL